MPAHLLRSDKWPLLADSLLPYLQGCCSFKIARHLELSLRLSQHLRNSLDDLIRTHLALQLVLKYISERLLHTESRKLRLFPIGTGAKFRISLIGTGMDSCRYVHAVLLPMEKTIVSAIAFGCWDAALERQPALLSFPFTIHHFPYTFRMYEIVSDRDGGGCR